MSNNNHNFIQLQNLIEEKVFNHSIILNNKYTSWFAKGDQNIEQIKDFIIQFSVFSNQFVIAQLNKVINAPTIEHMRSSKEILVNELGVIFKTKKKSDNDIYDLDLNTDVTVEGGIFKFRAAHFEWLVNTANSVGLSFDQIGKRSHANESTLHFCDTLIDLYGNMNYNISQACSFAIENWANSGFWKELILGFEKFNEKNNLKIPLGFFVWHDNIEQYHAQHTQEELKQFFTETNMDQEEFIFYANKILDALQVFWEGIKK